MKIYLLDTNILIALFSEKSGLPMRRYLKRFQKPRSVLATCGVILGEFYTGLTPNLAEQYSVYLDQFQYLPSSKSIYEQAGLLAYRLRKQGKSIPLIDCIIAQTAKHYNAELITFDKDFQRIQKLKKRFPNIPV